jgi:hypothetical protein
VLAAAAQLLLEAGCRHQHQRTLRQAGVLGLVVVVVLPELRLSICWVLVEQR